MNNPSFRLNIQAAIKKIVKNKPKVSRLCSGEIIFIDNELKIKIPINKVDNLSDKDYIVVPLSAESKTLKGKTLIFSKEKDKTNHYVCIIREPMQALHYPGDENRYASFRPGNIIAGFIYNNNGKLVFNYEKFIKFSDNSRIINNVKIEENKPLFKC